MKGKQIITAMKSFIAAILAMYISDYLTDDLEPSATMNSWFSILLDGLIAGSLYYLFAKIFKIY